MEQCDLEPQTTCRQMTKLVPALLPQEECVQVPKEVCALSKTNPKKIKIPFIQNWCYDPLDVDFSNAATTTTTATTTTGSSSTEGTVPEIQGVIYEPEPSENEDSYITAVKNDQFIDTIDSWGPDFNIKFQLNVADFDNGGLGHPYSDVLHFTATEKTCCSEGDRLPSVHLHKDGKVIISMWVDDGGNIYYTSSVMHSDSWYSFHIKQEAGVFTIFRDGHLQFRHVNKVPQTFKNVRVFAAHGSAAANALIKDLEFSSNGQVYPTNAVDTPLPLKVLGCSSSLDNKHPPENALPGSLGFWQSAPEDINPWIEFAVDDVSFKNSDSKEVDIVEVRDRPDCCHEMYQNVEVRVSNSSSGTEVSCGIQSYSGNNTYVYR